MERWENGYSFYCNQTLIWQLILKFSRNKGTVKVGGKVQVALQKGTEKK
jgi:hypothetical protein